MSDVSKFINLLIEYGQKIDSLIHKKYKPFIRSTLNLESLARNVHPSNSNNRLIVFRLGLESKSNKCVDVSLQYLHKLFSQNFIDLNAPNYCENYIIEQDGVRQKVVEKYEKQVRHQLVRLLQPLVHFKSNQINQNLLKNFQYLIGQQVLIPIVEICYTFPAQSAFNSLCSYFNYRAYLYQEFCLYTEVELKSINSVLLKTEKNEIQLKRALDHNEKFCFLIEKYLEEAISRSMIKGGGKYGFCLMCGQHANHYCKQTKVSLCGLECKKIHLQMAEKFYKQNIQAEILEKELTLGLSYLLECLYRKESTLVMNVIIYILEHASLFLMIKHKFRVIWKKMIPKVISKLYESKNENIFSNIYTLMGNITKYYTVECFAEVGYFLKTSVIKVLQDKKPKYHSLMLMFKTLYKVFQHGKTTIELYVNFDCQLNQENYIEKIMFELAKIVQDKFVNYSAFSKQEKIAIKNSCVTLFIMLAQGLNQYRKFYPLQIKDGIQNILSLKQRKTSIQKFTLKFNEQWSSGLKALFNMGLVGLDSDEQITDIILTGKNLKKQNIDLMMLSQPGKVYFKLLVKNIKQKHRGIFRQFIEYFRYLPLKKTSLSQKLFSENFEHDRKDRNLQKDVYEWIQTINKMHSFEQFKKLLSQIQQLEGIPSPNQIQQSERLYLLAVETKQQYTLGTHHRYFIHCSSKSFLQVMGSQISLLQIPMSYLLEMSFDIDRVLALATQLVQVCSHTNWVSMLIKNSFGSQFKTTQFTVDNVKIIKCILDLVKTYPQFLNDWFTIFSFIKNLHNILIGSTTPRRVPSDNRSVLLQQISVINLEKSIMSASQTLTTGFAKFINQMLIVAKEDIREERAFMLQKYFEVLENNIHKYLNDFDHIFEELTRFTAQIPQNNSETIIYIADMLKQSLIKLLKKQVGKNIQKAYFLLLKKLLEKKNKDVGDFVMNCISMVVVHHFRFHEETWGIIFEIMKNEAKQFRHQVHLIEQKIIAQNLKGCQNFAQQLVKISLSLVDREEVKQSVESIHSIRKVLGRQLQRISPEQAKKVYEETLLQLVSFINYDCHEAAIQMIFLLLQTKLESNDEQSGLLRQQNLFTNQDFQRIFQKIYSYLDKLPIEQHQKGEKIMNQSLYWSVKHQNYSIIFNLEKCIVDNYQQFSLAAIKCIKTFIQMVNPKEKQQWLTIENTLIHIIKDTKLDQVLRISQQSNAKEERPIEDQIDISKLTKKLVIQKMAVQLLPNDADCLQQLQEIYQQSIQFNDDIPLRCKLWKAGLGQRGDSAPNILNLEQVISNRILAIFNSSQNFPEMYKFGINIMDRYREASQNLKKFIGDRAQQNSLDLNNTDFQMYQLKKKYFQLRRVPLQKIIIYLLPKANKFCSDDKTQKQILVQKIINVLPFVDKRDNYIRAIEQLTGVSHR